MGFPVGMSKQFVVRGTPSYSLACLVLALPEAAVPMLLPGPEPCQKGEVALFGGINGSVS